MGTATRVTALLLTSAAMSLACSEDPAPPPPPIDYDALLKNGAPAADAGSATRPSINVEGWPAIDPGAASPKPVTQAIATLQAYGNDITKASGSIRFTATGDGAGVKVDLAGLTFLSKYTIRVHLFGDCSGDGDKTGRGYNFAGSSLDQPDPRLLMGVVAEIEGDVSGAGKGEQNIPGIAIRGPYSIVGRSVVLHAKSTDAASDGPRLACGVIGMVDGASAQ